MASGARLSFRRTTSTTKKLIRAEQQPCEMDTKARRGALIVILLIQAISHLQFGSSYPSSLQFVNSTHYHTTSGTINATSPAPPYQPKPTSPGSASLAMALASALTGPSNQALNSNTRNSGGNCSQGLTSFEISTGFIYKTASSETLATLPSTLQLTDCLGFCLANSSCLAINFEMGLCVLLSSSARQNPSKLYTSQFPVFTIYAEKLCLLAGDPIGALRHRRRCQRAWTFERVAGFEMKTKPRRKLKLATKESCMDACIGERDFECRSANWHRQTGECLLNDQDRHSVVSAHQQLAISSLDSGATGSDAQAHGALTHLYGPSNVSAPARPPANPPGLYQNYHYSAAALASHLKLASPSQRPAIGSGDGANANNTTGAGWWPHSGGHDGFMEARGAADGIAHHNGQDELPVSAQTVDYLENNCVYEPNKLCEFRKITNRVLKTVDSIYEDVASLDECKQRCLRAPYRCYSFDYGDTSDRVCRTSHLDQASLMSVREPYLEVAGAITYEMASCFNVTVQCRAREMSVQVASNRLFRGKIYARSRPLTCANDVVGGLKFELALKYQDRGECDIRSTVTGSQGVFSGDIIIQHHDRIVTSQDVGLTVHCEYELTNKSILSSVDLAVERLDELLASPTSIDPLESKQNQNQLQSQSQQHPTSSSVQHQSQWPMSITSLATTVVRSPNVTMKITDINGLPVSSATVGDRLALLFEIKEKTTPFGISIRDIVAIDGRQVAAEQGSSSTNKHTSYHYASNNNHSSDLYNQDDNELASNKLQSSSIQSNSVMLIDGDGCPTDANIMGQLVRLDASGRRFLAPFDAFKFPASDTVFFRALITSCVSECKPAVCSPAPNGLLSMSSLSHYTAPDLVPETPVSLQTTTRGLSDQPSSQLEQRSRVTGPSSSTTTLPTTKSSTATPTTAASTTMSAGMSTTTTPIPSPSLSPKAPATDTTTTVAGFSTQRPPTSTTTTATSIVSLNKTPDLQHSDVVEPQLPPLVMDFMTEAQRNHLVDMFSETRLRLLANGSLPGNNLNQQNQAYPNSNTFMDDNLIPRVSQQQPQPQPLDGSSSKILVESIQSQPKNIATTTTVNSLIPELIGDSQGYPMPAATTNETKPAEPISRLIEKIDQLLAYLRSSPSNPNPNLGDVSSLPYDTYVDDNYNEVLVSPSPQILPTNSNSNNNNLMNNNNNNKNLINSKLTEASSEDSDQLMNEPMQNDNDENGQAILSASQLTQQTLDELAANMVKASTGASGDSSMSTVATSNVSEQTRRKRAAEAATGGRFRRQVAPLIELGQWTPIGKHMVARSALVATVGIKAPPGGAASNSNRRRRALEPAAEVPEELLVQSIRILDKPADQDKSPKESPTTSTTNNKSPHSGATVANSAKRQVAPEASAKTPRFANAPNTISLSSWTVVGLVSMAFVSFIVIQVYMMVVVYRSGPNRKVAQEWCQRSEVSSRTRSGVLARRMAPLQASPDSRLSLSSSSSSNSNLYFV